MRPAGLACAALLLAAGFAAPPAQAQICLDFLVFCDGLEIQISEDNFSGIWRNRRCDGVDSPLVGVIRNGIPNPCVPETGRVGLVCLPEAGCVEFDGNDEWFFVFNELNGILDLGHSEDGVLPPPGSCSFFGGVSYQILPGPCPFFQHQPGRPSISSEQAGR